MAAGDREIISQFLTAIRDEIRAQLPKVTGRTRESVKVENLTETTGEITVPWRLFTFQDGRKPGTMPPISEIQKWLDAKGLDISPWAVAIKMRNEGNTLWRVLHGKPGRYTPVRVEFDKIITPQRISALVETFAGKYQSLVSSDLLEPFKKNR
jgi:copper chaperone CopZ